MAPHIDDNEYYCYEKTIPQKPREIQSVGTAKIAGQTVWRWILDEAANSPVQPVVNLGTSFIEYNPPDFLIEAHQRALNNLDDQQYAPVEGTPALKQAISDVYSPLHGRKLDVHKEICVVNGALEGLLSCVMSFVQPGDEVILLEPVFEMYVYQIKLAGGTVKYVPLRPPKNSGSRTVSGNDWVIDMAELKQAITPKTKMMYLNTPQNPLGKVFTRTELAEIGNLCVSRGLVLLTDEVYERMTFPDPAHRDQAVPHTRVASISPEIAECTLSVTSLGKIFNATGWRVGFVIGPEKLMKEVIPTHFLVGYSCSPPAQDAFAVALREAERRDWWKVISRDIGKGIRKICDALDGMGLPYVAPLGAYFVLVNIERIMLPENYPYPELVRSRATRDWKVCYFLVHHFGVATIPGTCFYSPETACIGESYVRLGICKSDTSLDLARERLLKLKPFVSQADCRA